MGKGKGKGKKGKGDSRHAGWHRDLFGALMAMVAEDVKYAREHDRDPSSSKAKVLIICPLSRSGIPVFMIVRELVGKLWPSGEVSVLLASSARGLTASIVHVLRHRRFVGSADQYEGVQGDPRRAYTNMGRAQLKLVQWLEIQPFGVPTPAKLTGYCISWPLTALSPTWRRRTSFCSTPRRTGGTGCQRTGAPPSRQRFQ